MRIAVVGAGLTGLVASSLLARQGHDVVLLEATARTGGLAAPWRVGPHLFCPGPQYLWGFGAGEDGARIVDAVSARVSFRAVDDGFERVVVGDEAPVTIRAGRPDCGLSKGGVAFADVLDALGRCGDVIAGGASYTKSGPAMLARVAASSLSLADKACLVAHRDLSVRAAARRAGANDRDTRLLSASQPIFAERLDDLSVVLFAAARAHAVRVYVPDGGVVALVEALAGAAAANGVVVRHNAPVRGVAADKRGVVLDVDARDGAGVVAADHVVWCCSPAVVAALTGAPRGYEPSYPVHGVCLDVDVDDKGAAALEDKSVLWYADDDDVDFGALDGVGDGVGGDAPRAVRALHLLSPTLNAGAPGPRQLVCAYAPTGTSVADVVARARAIVPGIGAVHDAVSFDGAAWEAFGPGGAAVYGRRKTAASLQRSLQKGLPPRMSLAHAGAGIPGVLGCLQMAEAVAAELLS